MALRVDAEVANVVSSSREEFYQTNPWLRPQTPSSNLDKILEKIWDTAGDTVSTCWNGIIEFYRSNTGKKIFDGMLDCEIELLDEFYAPPKKLVAHTLVKPKRINSIHKALGEDIYYWTEYLEMTDIFDDEYYRTLDDETLKQMKDYLIVIKEKFISNNESCIFQDEIVIIEARIQYIGNLNKMISVEEAQKLAYEWSLNENQVSTFTTCWNYLVCDMELTEIQASAVLGNVYAESAFGVTNAQESNQYGWFGIDNSVYVSEYKADDGIGWGLIQWTYKPRKQGLYDLAVELNSDVGDINVQLQYLKYEMEENHDFIKSWNEIKESDTLEEASKIFLYGIEKPKNMETKLNERVKNADTIYQNICE